MNKKIGSRTFVRRVLMGPLDHFSPSLVADEVDGATGYKIWGVILQQDSRIDINAVRQAIGHAASSEEDWRLGVLRKDPPGQLTHGHHWQESGYLSFGDGDKAG